jgi:hypothetical protein
MMFDCYKAVVVLPEQEMSIDRISVRPLSPRELESDNFLRLVPNHSRALIQEIRIYTYGINTI